MALSSASPSRIARRQAAPGIAQDRRSRFVRLHEHPRTLAAVAVAIGAAVLAVVAAIAGWGAVGHAFGDLHPAWIALGVAGQLVAIAAYVAAFRAVSAVGHPTAVPLRVAVLVVLAGFGPHAVGGGFAVDERVLRALRGDPRCATIRVLGLGALEWALLAPAACIAAIVLLVAGSDVQRALLWSWALAVPAGFALGLWAAAPSRRERVPEKGTVRTGLRRALEGVGVLRALVAHPRRHAGAWLGMAGYWMADIATLYAAARLFGVSLDLAHTILAYATGYAATRRTLPLGGVGATEALMAASFVWIGLPLAQAVPIVAAYRLANVVLPLMPAARAQRRIAALMS
jgi:uncharacterized membrane protein YbhN (UPF0104 family)